MNLPRQILAVALTAAAEAFCSTAEAANSAASLLRGAAQQAEAPDDGRCENCGEAHEPLSAGLFGLIAAQRNRPKPDPGPSTTDREWSTVFADQVKPEDLIAVEGAQIGRDDLGLRALRVRDIREREAQGAFGITVKSLVFLLQDEDSGEPGTARVDRDQALRIATKAPDSVPADLGGGS